MRISDIHGLMVRHVVGSTMDKSRRWVIPRDWKGVLIPILLHVGVGLNLHSIEEVIKHLIIPYATIVNAFVAGLSGRKPRMRDALLAGRPRICSLSNAVMLVAAALAAQAAARGHDVTDNADPATRKTGKGKHGRMARQRATGQA